MSKFNPIDFVLVSSDDPLKRDLELTCGKCNLHLCDVQSDDTLRVLVEMAKAHTNSCKRRNDP